MFCQRPALLIALILSAMSSFADGVGVLRGTVRDETGAPVSGLILEGYQGLTGRLFSLKTDATGNYSATVENGSINLTFSSASLREQRVLSLPLQSIALEEGETRTYDIIVRRAPFDLDITLVNEDGSPIQTAPSPPYGIRMQTYFGDESYFVTKALATKIETQLSPGDWWLQPHLPEEFEPAPARVYSVTNSFELRITARRIKTASTLAGRVIDENGMPLPNIVVSNLVAGSWTTATTDAAGEFSFAVPAGRRGVAIGSGTAEGQSYLFPRPSLDVPEGGVGRLVIRAQRIRSTIQINFNPPSRIQDRDVFFTARTRVGNDYFVVQRYNEGVSARIPVFPGDWHISSNFIPDQLVQVTSGTNLIFSLASWDDPPSTIRGRLLDENGDGLAYGTIGAFDGRASGYNRANADGTFEILIKLYGNRYRMFVERNSGSVSKSRFKFVTSKYITVPPGGTSDVGDLKLPKTTTTARIKLIKPDGTLFASEGLYKTEAAHASGQVITTIESDSFTGDIMLPVFPGRWMINLGLGLNGYGYEAIPTFGLAVPTGGIDQNIYLKPLSAQSRPPSLTTVQVPDGSTRVRVQTLQTRNIDIEYSTNLKDWKYHSTPFPINGTFDLPEDSLTGQSVFYRTSENRD